jgi:hypothetical protein
VIVALVVITLQLGAQRADDLACADGTTPQREQVATTERRFCADARGVRRGTYLEDSARGHVEGTYVDGKMTGRWTATLATANARRIDAVMRDDELNGSCKMFDGAHLVEEAELADARAHGVWRVYARDGALRTELTFRGGVAHGLLRVLESGRLRELAVYVDGAEVKGSRVFFDRDGRVVAEWPEARQAGWQRPTRPPADARDWNAGPTCAKLAMVAFPRSRDKIESMLRK